MAEAPTERAGERGQNLAPSLAFESVPRSKASCYAASAAGGVGT